VASRANRQHQVVSDEALDLGWPRSRIVRFVEAWAGDVAGREVLEVGAWDPDGSLRAAVLAGGPRSYVGTDIRPGPSVDVIADVGRLRERFGRERFDLVLAIELLEHVADWRGAFSNLKGVLRPGGRLVLTTRSIGFPEHFGPFDHWRYEQDDMRRILRDMEILVIAADPHPGRPGVFVAATKPSGSVEADLADVALHSVILGRRAQRVTRWQILRFGLSSPRRAAHLLLPARVKDLLRSRVPAVRMRHLPWE
jgi:SAM-dependent methyltransferase